MGDPPSRLAALAAVLTTVAVAGLRVEIADPVRVEAVSIAPTPEEGELAVVNEPDRSIEVRRNGRTRFR